MAILVSIGSLLLAWESYTISKKNYLMNLEPILHVNTEIDNDMKVYFLIFHNAGPIKIYDIRINTQHRIFDVMSEKDMIYTSSKRIEQTEEWHIKEFLKQGQTEKIRIPYETFKEAYKGLMFFKQLPEYQEPGVLQSIFIFHIRFRTEPTKRIYRMKQYLGLFATNGDKNDIHIIDYNLSPHPYSPIKLLENIDEK